MGRNPVVGRQGPAYHAAEIPAEGTAARLRVRQIRSGIGHSATMRRTLEALGLKGHQAVAELPNNAGVRGMLFKVRHLIEVTPVQES
jgi:large subunit ribosomal protein L30